MRNTIISPNVLLTLIKAIRPKIIPEVIWLRNRDFTMSRFLLQLNSCNAICLFCDMITRYHNRSRVSLIVTVFLPPRHLQPTHSDNAGQPVCQESPNVTDRTHMDNTFTEHITFTYLPDKFDIILMYFATYTHFGLTRYSSMPSCVNLHHNKMELNPWVNTRTRICSNPISYSVTNWRVCYH